MTLAKKIVVLGSFGVGKTSLIRKFVTDEFSSDYKVTIGVHVLKKHVQIKNAEVSLILWDLEGTDDIEKINRAYLTGTHGIIYVYDVKRPSTYKNLEKDVNFLNTNYNPTCLKIIGNKSDLLSEKDYQQLSNSVYNPDFFSSAKTGDNVEHIFKSVATDLI